ncbi:MAG: HD domain-containing protein [bacterium]|nr:HD domain-containing protein [bacterium]
MKNAIYENMRKHNENLSKYACKDEDAIRFNEENDNDMRTPFFRDVDRIIYSLSYLRYMDKTQVFTTKQNDHIQKRMIHVQYVSKIARTIGRALNLNEDLIEAAALGHDLGHTPFGHVGERILNKISLENNEGYFFHNLHSVRTLMNIENFGNGNNISVQVLDAIMCHNGELVSNEYYPKLKTKEDFLNEYNDSLKSSEVAKYLRPMTLEGCVVRISDIIAYLGRDIEDGVRMNLISFDKIPKEIVNVLGKNNREIVNTITTDIINESLDKNYIKMSDNVFNAIKKLKDFNYENIYSKAYSTEELNKIENMFRTLFKSYLNDLKTNNRKSTIFTSYLNNMDEIYLQNTLERIVIDYIAGMTDDYFISQYNLIINK